MQVVILKDRPLFCSCFISSFLFPSSFKMHPVQQHLVGTAPSAPIMVKSTNAHAHMDTPGSNVRFEVSENNLNLR
jgi:hypothetical protein